MTKRKRMRDLRTRAEPIPNLGLGRDDFDRDYTAILYSHAFRRLRHKTQVFFYPESDHVCTRLDHSLYVAAISDLVCKNLRSRGIDCNPTLARAIGIGHDLGHAPFGHAGQEILNRLAKDIDGFAHERHGLRIVEKIDKPRAQGPVIGLNLTLAVRDGIVNHYGEDPSTSISPADSPKLDGRSYPCTVEGCIVRLVDKIAYLGRDLEDAVDATLLKESDVPGEIAAIIGTRNGEIVDYFVGDIIDNSDADRISLSETASKLMGKMTKFNQEVIYGHKIIESYKQKTRHILDTLFDWLMERVHEFEDRVDLYMQDKSLRLMCVFGKFIGDRSILYFEEEPKTLSRKGDLHKRIVIDFMSTLTDNFVFQSCSELFLPKSII